MNAIKQLKDQMISLKKVVCKGCEENRAPVQSLEEVNEQSTMQRAIARVKAQKAKQV